jgi:preprotein translocase subunit SecG
MRNIFLFIQIFVAILLIFSILSQSRGAGLGSAWGGSSEFYTTRRGMEKIIFIATIVLAALFLLLSIINLLLK